MPVRLMPILCLLLLMAGCTTTYVGPRLGLDVPVSRPEPTVHLAGHKQSGYGVAGGLWFWMKISDHMTHEVLPGAGSQQFTSDLAVPYINTGLDVELRSYQKASLSYLDLPLHLRHGFVRSSAAVVPYVLVGGWPFFDERPRASNAESHSTALVVVGGVELELHDFALAIPATSIGLTAGIVGHI